jgi:hypothetical protein
VGAGTVAGAVGVLVGVSPGNAVAVGVAVAVTVGDDVAVGPVVAVPEPVHAAINTPNTSTMAQTMGMRRPSIIGLILVCSIASVS